MIRFRSPATGDVQMLEAHGRHLLGVIGKNDSERGVITPAEMADAIDRLQAASRQDLHEHEQERHGAEERQEKLRTHEDDDELTVEPERVSLAQRSFPLVQMLKRAQAAGEPVLWGV